jgi:hypothetical protein
MNHKLAITMASLITSITASVAHADDNPALRFARALDARRNAQDWKSRKEAELGVGKALKEAGLSATAHRAFEVLLADEEAPAEVRKGALKQINQIERELPSITHVRSAEILPEGRADAITREWLFRQFQLSLGRGSDLKAASNWASLITPADSPHARMARSWLLALSRKPAEAYKILTELLKLPSLPADLATQLNANRILAARLAYALRRPAEGALWLRAVDKKSNLAPSSLEELTWALLEADAPGEAIGTALQLQKGLMLRAFVPEAPMVQAMALNEACHFPAAFKTIQDFRRKWEGPHRWLGEATAKPRALVPQLRDLLREKKNSHAEIPKIVGWELIRSPRFVSNESLRVEIEQTPTRFNRLREQARSTQLKLAQDILRSNEKLSRDIKAWRLKNPEGDLPQQILSRLETLRSNWKDYRALRKSTGPLARMAQHSKAWGPRIVAELTVALEADLQRKMKRMQARLDDVMDNLGLMEIEILDGASRDIVWQNAHPDFAVEIKQQLSNYDRGETWSWGRAWTQIDAESGENEEVWEDELGAHGVALADRCEQKDRYLSLKRRNLQASN